MLNNISLGGPKGKNSRRQTLAPPRPWKGLNPDTSKKCARAGQARMTPHIRFGTHLQTQELLKTANFANAQCRADKRTRATSVVDAPSARRRCD